MKCTHCQKELIPQSKYCTYCGRPVELLSTSNATVENATENAASLVRKRCSKKKRSKPKMLRVVLILLLLSALGIVAEEYFQKLPTDMHSNDSISDHIQGIGIQDGFVQDIENEKNSINVSGVLQGDLYWNEWADLQLKFPEGFVNATDKYYKIYENLQDIECELVVTDGSAFCYFFIAGLPNRIATEKMLLESEVNDLIQGGLEQGYTAAIEKENYGIEIAGTQYLGTSILMEKNEQTNAVSFYFRILDDRVCIFQVLGATTDSNEWLVSKFEPCNMAHISM